MQQRRLRSRLSRALLVRLEIPFGDKHRFSKETGTLRHAEQQCAGPHALQGLFIHSSCKGGGKKSFWDEQRRHRGKNQRAAAREALFG